jgi:hypothetical protein
MAALVMETVLKTVSELKEDGDAVSKNFLQEQRPKNKMTNEHFANVFIFK